MYELDLARDSPFAGRVFEFRNFGSGSLVATLQEDRYELFEVQQPQLTKAKNGGTGDDWLQTMRIPVFLVGFGVVLVY